jgi:hypothetical protein
LCKISASNFFSPRGQLRIYFVLSPPGRPLFGFLPAERFSQYGGAEGKIMRVWLNWIFLFRKPLFVQIA